MTTDQVNFFGLGEEQLWYDERKKRFVSSKNAPEFVNRSFRHAHFKEVSAKTFESAATPGLVWSTTQRVPNEVEVWPTTHQTDELPNQVGNETFVALDGWHVIPILLPSAR